MNILYFFYPVIIVLGLYFKGQGNTAKNRRWYIFIILALLAAESCLRGVSIGSDTETYYFMYQKIKDVSWNEVLTGFNDRYLEKSDTEDWGFSIYCKLLQLITDNFQFYLLISALCFFIPYGMLLNRYAKDTLQLMFIFILYVSLFNPIAMSGVRKEIALGASVLAYLYYVDKKYLRMWTVVLLSTTMHMSTLLFLLIPLMDQLPKKLLRTSHLVAFVMIPFVILSSSSLIVFMGEAVDNERYAAYGSHGYTGSGMTFTIMIEMLSLFCYVALKRIDLEKDKMMGKLYVTLPLFTFFAPLITNNGSMIRISQYFHIYLPILLVYAMDNFSSRRERTILYVGMSAALMVMALTTQGEGGYVFFWQDEFRYLFI